MGWLKKLIERKKYKWFNETLHQYYKTHDKYSWIICIIPVIALVIVLGMQDTIQNNETIAQILVFIFGFLCLIAMPYTMFVYGIKWCDKKLKKEYKKQFEVNKEV